jgi:molybdenum cofactor cytidylyltransferase
MERISGIILAAGESSRMGEDKALLDWAGKTFLERLLGVVAAAGLDPVRVVLGANAEAIQLRIQFGGGQVVVNREWKQGQLSSLVAGLESLPGGVEAAVVCLVDHPCVSSRLLRRLEAEFRESGKPIVIPTFHGRRGHPVLFAARLFDELRAAPREQGARFVVHQHSAELREVPVDEEGILLNINDKASYEKILQMAPPS